MAVNAAINRTASEEKLVSLTDVSVARGRFSQVNTGLFFGALINSLELAPLKFAHNWSLRHLFRRRSFYTIIIPALTAQINMAEITDPILMLPTDVFAAHGFASVTEWPGKII